MRVSSWQNRLSDSERQRVARYPCWRPSHWFQPRHKFSRGIDGLCDLCGYDVYRYTHSLHGIGMASDYDRKVRVKSVGMFDNNLGTPFTDTFQEGETFTLQAAKIGPEISTEYGPARIVLLKIDGELYSLFGKSLENQIANMESGDLPAEVKLIRVKSKKGNKGMKVLWPASKETPEDTFTTRTPEDTFTTPDDMPF